MTAQIDLTTAPHLNAVRMREAFAAFDRGDLDAVLESMTDDCTWQNEGTGPIAGVHTGKAAITDMFVQLFTLTDGTFKTVPISILADEDRSIAVYDATVTVAGTTDTLRWVLVDEHDADGKVTSTHCFCYDQAAADALLSRAIPPQR